MTAWFYILRLSSGGLYCGSTKNIEKRYNEHLAGNGARMTSIDKPIAIVHQEEYETYKEAYRREQQIKRWTRLKKEALIKGDLKELKRLAKRREKHNCNDT